MAMQLETGVTLEMCKQDGASFTVLNLILFRVEL